jgi:hypothetical protein
VLAAFLPPCTTEPSISQPTHRVRPYHNAPAVLAGVPLLDQALDTPNELAHYYQFEQILKSMQSGGAWSNYQDDVFPMAANPASFISQFPASAIALNTNFNGLFSRLLDQLHAAFNSSNPDTGVQTAINTMLDLQAPGQALMQIALSQGPGNCGPTFEYIGSPASISTPA